MTYTEGLVLGVVQGLTEFLPVSSSGHLVLVPLVFGWPDQGLAFDAVMHLGTLAALVAYFRFELLALVRGTLPLTAALVAAFVSGWATVWCLVNYLRRGSLMPFVIYRFVLAALIAAVVR